MNDATVKFGYDGRELYAGLAEQDRRMRDSATRMGDVYERQEKRVNQSVQRMAKNKNPAMSRLGGVSMQAQDIAVQLQMGAKTSTIIAQQGSQMLSAFGPAGAVVGGLVAIGAMMYSMGEQSKSSFKAIEESAKNFGKSLKGVLADASVSNLGQNVDLFAKKIQDLEGEINKLESYSGAAGAVVDDVFMGGKSMNEKMRDITKFRNEVNAAFGDVLEATLKDSTELVKIAEMKARGDEDGAEALERQLDLTREIARINQLQIPVYAKQQLIADAEAKSSIQASAAARAAKEKAREQDKELQRKREALALEHVNVELLELQARGHDKLAEKARKKQEIQRRAQELSAMGLDANAAIALAKREQKAREDLDFRERTGRSKIGGVKNRRMMGFGGLDEFARMQQKVELPLDVRTPAGVRGARVGPDGHFYGGYAPVNTQDLASRGRRAGRMMGSESATGALSTRPAVSTSGAQAGTQASAGRENGNSVPDLLSKLIAVASRGFFGR